MGTRQLAGARSRRYILNGCSDNRLQTSKQTFKATLVAFFRVGPQHPPPPRSAWRNNVAEGSAQASAMGVDVASFMNRQGRTHALLDSTGEVRKGKYRNRSTCRPGKLNEKGVLVKDLSVLSTARFGSTWLDMSTNVLISILGSDRIVKVVIYVQQFVIDTPTLLWLSMTRPYNFSTSHLEFFCQDKDTCHEPRLVHSINLANSYIPISLK